MTTRKSRTPKQQVESRAAARGITITRETPSMDGDPIGELVAPDGKRFGDDIHALTFMDWADALDRLNAFDLTDCPADCDCRDEVISDDN